MIHVSKLSDSGPWSVWQVLQLLLYPIPLLLSLSWPALASPFSSVLAALLVLPPLTAPKTGQPSTRSHYVHILSPCTTSCWSSWAGASRRRHCRCGFGGEGHGIGTQRRNSRKINKLKMGQKLNQLDDVEEQVFGLLDFTNWKCISG